MKLPLLTVNYLLFHLERLGPHWSHDVTQHKQPHDILYLRAGLGHPWRRCQLAQLRTPPLGFGEGPEHLFGLPLLLLGLEPGRGQACFGETHPDSAVTEWFGVCVEGGGGEASLLRFPAQFCSFLAM